jgi:hypothetical protein
MFKFLTSLSFLYFFTIVVLLLYGFIYHRDFKKGRYRRKLFPGIFLLISVACLSFLWVNIHAPLRLETFSNLDHHFIRHEGFQVTKKIELGGSDTVNYGNNPFSSFLFASKSLGVTVSSGYSEEPFYVNNEGGYRIASVNYPAAGHVISFRCDKVNVTIRADNDDWIVLKVGEDLIRKQLKIKKGISCWNVFRNEDSFINTAYFNNEKLIASLGNIFLLRDDVSRNAGGDLKYFLSGRLFKYAGKVKYDEQDLQLNSLQFDADLPNESSIAWGIGFLDNNRNQYWVNHNGTSGFLLTNRYPVAYPLAEEQRNDWSNHHINKFLLSDANDMHRVPAMSNEGFLFPVFNSGSRNHFSPALLSYQKGAKNSSLLLKAQLIDNPKNAIALKDDKLVLSSISNDFNWIFSIQNTFNWHFGDRALSPPAWQGLLFGSLGLFIILVFFASFTKPADKQSWVWQLLCCVAIVLLVTRFFLYWRYKTFPPYEGMDLPSQQQLQSLSNFVVILFATFVLALIFGFDFLETAYYRLRKAIANLFNTSYSPGRGKQITGWLKQSIPEQFLFARQVGKINLFFACWLLLLVGCGALAALNGFDVSVCRHLAIALMLAYFVFLFISYKYSPLVASAKQSWWEIGTGSFLTMIISNPVKILLSVSLLALFVFIDIGFAIVFLNFLFFNEAFLCINYGIAGLSAGSKKNARSFATLGIVYLLFFVLNLFYAPYVFKFLLDMPQWMYVTAYILFAIVVAYMVVRLLPQYSRRRKATAGFATATVLFAVAFFFFPKERILDKASMTKYRIDVLTTPVDEAITAAYEEGKTYEPVIRAAQNQWFINTFIHEDNNPGVQSAGFRLLAHAPQNKGAKYNAQATDLVTSRFLIAEHGKSSVLLYVLLLLLPIIMLASFYKLYPDFTNRVNIHYPTITAGFSVLNYLLITALLVILAATGRYIFFGQDLPFASILSKQSILFPCILILAVVLLFKNVPQEHYSNRKKVIPGAIIFLLLAVLLFFFKPVYNKTKEFAVGNLAKDMDSYIQLRLQPVLDYFDTSAATKKLTLANKDKLFTDSVRSLIATSAMKDDNKFFAAEINAYARSGFARHIDQRRMLYLDSYAGSPQLAVNENYFRVEPPPHLQQLWKGNVFGDTAIYNVVLWNAGDGTVITKRLNGRDDKPAILLDGRLVVLFQSDKKNDGLYLVNRSGSGLRLREENEIMELEGNGKYRLRNPCRIVITDSLAQQEQVLTIEPDAFMKNYYVNGSRFYIYPMKSRFIWARNFAEAVSSDYTSAGDTKRNAFVSFDFELMDSLSAKIQMMMAKDTAYKKGAEYGISIADGNGRIIALTDFIKGFNRPDPNNKAAFNKVIVGENGFISQSLLRKQVGNINLLRMNPGPGSTFKPVVFSAIASQLRWNWDDFAAEGFSEKQTYYGGEKVPEYDFEKDNGRISTVSDYLKYSDNYYHSNVLLLGSYQKQEPSTLLSDHFEVRKPGTGLHWPYFTYTGKQYWLNGFKNWPGYAKGKADFGLDSSFTTMGLLNNYGIYTHEATKSFDMFVSVYDSLLFLDAYRKSGFILPEYSLFDQHGDNVDHRIPYDLFTSCFRGHVKGSSQVMVSPVKMAEAFGKLISQNRNYNLTLNPYSAPPAFLSFDVATSIPYNNYLSIIRENVFTGMREALFTGTAARLGGILKDGKPYYYYAKTGTTGDDQIKAKSKLLAVIISSRDVTDPGFNFRDNKFYTVYFTSQNGPAKQNEEFQAEVIRYLQETLTFNRYMQSAQ